MFESSRVVCVRLSGRVSGLIRDRKFDLEQEEQRPGAGGDAAAARGDPGAEAGFGRGDGVLPSRRAVANHKRKEPTVLKHVAEGVLVHQSELLQNNAVVVQGRAGVLLIDPGITGNEMACLAKDLRELGQPVVAGFSTHPDWDHVLWHEELGEAPRYGTARCAASMRDLRSNADWKTRVGEGLPPEIAEEIPLDLFGLITGLLPETARIPWDGPQVRIIEHPAHAQGHAALFIEERGVLVAGDMLSDVFIPMLDNFNGTNDPIEDYLVGLRLLEDVADDVDVVIPGHGSVGRADQVRARIEQDRAYVHALRDGHAPDDPRIGPSAKPGWEWVSDIHEGQAQRLARRSERDGTPG
jgi:glyoxylase-like metal-dependent hydrolase (beta-lactamase superfamily II)